MANNEEVKRKGKRQQSVLKLFILIPRYICCSFFFRSLSGGVEYFRWCGKRCETCLEGRDQFWAQYTHNDRSSRNNEEHIKMLVRYETICTIRILVQTTSAAALLMHRNVLIWLFLKNLVMNKWELSRNSNGSSWVFSIQSDMFLDIYRTRSLQSKSLILQNASHTTLGMWIIQHTTWQFCLTLYIPELHIIVSYYLWNTTHGSWVVLWKITKNYS